MIGGVATAFFARYLPKKYLVNGWAMAPCAIAGSIVATKIIPAKIIFMKSPAAMGRCYRRSVPTSTAQTWNASNTGTALPSIRDLAKPASFKFKSHETGSGLIDAVNCRYD
jgi:hypothetical protein